MIKKRAYRLINRGRNLTDWEQGMYDQLLYYAYPERWKASQQRRREKIRAYSRRWQKCRRDEGTDWATLNPVKHQESVRKYRLKRRRTDLQFRLRCNLRRRVNVALHGIAKSKKTLKLLGCSIEDFKIYLESKFEVGMSWENYGHKGWHIDHIIPCCLFDLTKAKHQKVCFHFSNMQPLWAVENWAKSRSEGGNCALRKHRLTAQDLEERATANNA